MTQFKRIRQRYKKRAYDRWLWKVSFTIDDSTSWYAYMPCSFFDVPGTATAAHDRVDGLLTGEIGRYRGVRFIGTDLAKGEDATVLSVWENALPDNERDARDVAAYNREWVVKWAADLAEKVPK